MNAHGFLFEPVQAAREDEIIAQAQRATLAALGRMRPGDTLVIDRHKFEAGKALFTFTVKSASLPGDAT